MVSGNRNCPTLADFFSASVFNAVFAFASLHGPIPQLGTPPGDFAFAGYRYLVKRRRFTGAFAEPAAHHEPLVFQIDSRRAHPDAGNVRLGPQHKSQSAYAKPISSTSPLKPDIVKLSLYELERLQARMPALADNDVIVHCNP